MAKRNKGGNKKDRIGVVYSTNEDFDYDMDGDEDQEDVAPGDQQLRVELDKKARAGKQVTLITGFQGYDDSLKELGKILKSKCGVGGSAKDGEILIQGDFRVKIEQVLKGLGYKVKRIGG